MYKSTMRVYLYQSILVSICFLTAMDANAAIDNNNLLDSVLNVFINNASTWANLISSAATRLYWTLVIISMVWTFGMMALRKADIGEFFAEFTRFIVFTGFYWWLLINGPAIASSIIRSLMELGGQAAALGGYAGTFTPTSLLDIGFILFGRTLAESSVWSPVDSTLGIVLGLAILVLTALIAINMLLLLISAWVLSYAGIFFLGFGGSRWTSDIAINYYKTVLSIAAQVMTMVLLIGIGVSLIEDYYTRMETGLELSEMAVIAIVALAILRLSNKLPQLVSGIITGASIGGGGIGQLGLGAVLGAASTATAAASMAGAMLGAGAAQAAGGASALMAAFSQANTNVLSGSDILSAFAGGGPGSSGSSASGRGSSSGSSAYAEAAGHNRNNTAASTSGPIGSGNSPGQSASGRGGNDQGTSAVRSSGPNPVSRAARVGADTAANLARGSYDAGKAATGSFMDLLQTRIADTPGGRVASAIRERGAEQAAPAFEGNSISGTDSREVNREEEVAVFVNKTDKGV